MPTHRARTFCPLPLPCQLLPSLTVSLVKTYQGCSSGEVVWQWRCRHTGHAPSLHLACALPAAHRSPRGAALARRAAGPPPPQRRHRAPFLAPPRPAAAFRYSHKLAPRRLLTKPAEPASNGGWDNANHDLIVAVGDEFVSTLGTRWV